LWGIKSLPHQAAVFERDLLRSIGGYDPVFGLAADQDLMLRAMLSSEPSWLRLTIADCPDGGVGSRQGAAVFVGQMSMMRRQRGVRLTQFATLDRALSVVLRILLGVALRVRSGVRSATRRISGLANV
jgi:hypothetical protein